MWLSRDIDDIYGPKKATHTLSDVVRRFGDTLEAASRCQVCGGKPTIRRKWDDPENRAIKVIARCHRASRILEVDDIVVETFADQPELAALHDFCRNPFPVNFYRYGFPSAAARREFRARMGMSA